MLISSLEDGLVGLNKVYWKILSPNSDIYSDTQNSDLQEIQTLVSFSPKLRMICVEIPKASFPDS
jgi:hypothetical protein